MNLSFRRFLCVATATVMMGGAVAQTVYKCGNAYSEEPCVDGRAMAVQDLRTDAQKSQANETTIRQKNAARKFEVDRIAQEQRDAEARRDAGSTVTVVKPMPKAQPVAGKLGKATRIKPVKPIKPVNPVKPVKVSKKKKVSKPAG